MADAMVTARMPQSKKEAGNKILKELGYSASQAINALYDTILEKKAWPFDTGKKTTVDAGALAEALAFVDGIAQVEPGELDRLSDDEWKRRRLIEKGRATEDDFR